MIGLRHEIGADWFNYAEQIYSASFETLASAITLTDPAYSFLNWLAARLDQGPYFVNTVCAALFTWGLLVFCRAQPLPWLALLVAIPYLVIVVGMGYTRQGVAIGLAMMGLAALGNRKFLHFIIFLLLAATFHKSAVILMPLAVLAGTRSRFWTLFWVLFATTLAFVFLVQDSLERLQYTYLEREYESQGAAVRVAMNALPAVVFLLFRRRFAMERAQSIFWTWMSLGALAFIGLLALSPSSTAVDRLALYWIPLQILVFSRLPDAISKLPTRNVIWVSLVVVYSATVLFVWLYFSNHSQAWLPYQFYPWVLFWH